MNDSVAADEVIKSLQKEIDTAKGYEKLLQANLAALDAEPSMNDIRANVTILELEKEELAHHLERLRSGKIKPVRAAEREAVEMVWTEWARKADSRKRIFMGMWRGIVRDVLTKGQTKEQLWEELGLESDGD
ncbi:MAG: hypothetical protein Q9201_000726 [Fulgogasparrea decipioides]